MYGSWHALSLCLVSHRCLSYTIKYLVNCLVAKFISTAESSESPLALMLSLKVTYSTIHSVTFCGVACLVFLSQDTSFQWPLHLRATIRQWIFRELAICKEIGSKILPDTKNSHLIKKMNRVPDTSTLQLIFLVPFLRRQGCTSTHQNQQSNLP